MGRVGSCIGRIGASVWIDFWRVLCMYVCVYLHGRLRVVWLLLEVLGRVVGY